MSSEEFEKDIHQFNFSVGTGATGRFKFYFDEWNDDNLQQIEDMVRFYKSLKVLLN